MIFNWNLLNLLRADKLHFEVQIAIWKPESGFQVNGFRARLLCAWLAFGKSAICSDSAHKFCLLFSCFPFVLFYLSLPIHSHYQPHFSVFLSLLLFYLLEIHNYFLPELCRWTVTFCTLWNTFSCLYVQVVFTLLLPISLGWLVNSCSGYRSAWPPVFIS